jgi:hypothetical protein
LQSDVLTSHPTQLQQPQPRTRRYCQWARQHDAHYLQGLVHALLCFLFPVSCFLLFYILFLICSSACETFKGRVVEVPACCASR